MRLFILFLFLLSTTLLVAQISILGKITSEGEPVEFASIYLKGTRLGTTSSINGAYQIDSVPEGTYTILVSALGYEITKKDITVSDKAHTTLYFELIKKESTLDEVVVSGTMKEVSKLSSPVPVEVFSPKFFKANPTPSIYEAMQNVNGVRPQVNCNVCNTGDIHINGLEGPYTMILIDGMPIVSGLSTVYGLNGIPQSLIERVEVVKGPASTLYGSEAVGGLINIITKQPNNAPLFSVDIFGTTWGELNTDLSSKFNIGKNTQSLLGINYFNYSNPIDNNEDNFTDVTLQDRISVFNKWNFNRESGKIFSLAGRYVYEDRWGGEMQWSPEFRGGDSVYGESIYTSRWELLGTYELPIREKVRFSFSANGHNQNSVYGNTVYLADQRIAFGQLIYDKSINDRHSLLLGTAMRYIYYDDNTPATASNDSIEQRNLPSKTYLPGVFIQDEININDNNKLLLGMRYDYNSIHGNIFTPRLNYKWNSANKENVLRLSIGNGYRVANIFTEDHAALTGSREVIFISELKPETSWNTNVNFVKKVYADKGLYINIDATAFYTYFDNKIFADYDTDPNKIIYDNLDGHAISNGISTNLDFTFPNGLKTLIGGTVMDVYSINNGIRERQPFTEQFTGVWNISYTLRKVALTINYTGNLYGPMRLPLISNLDPRSDFSPWWSIQNIQFTKKIKKEVEVYIGIKNLLNWTPNKGNPFIIARSHDPFDKNVVFDPNGQAVANAANPYGLTFDPSYVYGPNQGIRAFLGFRYNFK